LHQVYDVVREGTQIGTNTVDIERRGDTTEVKIKTKISVKIMYIEAYRYEHEAYETWKTGQLVAFKSETDDNGTKHVLSVIPVSNKLDLTVDGHHNEAPLSLRPASLWNKNFDSQTQLFDPANGQRLSVKVQDLGSEDITIHGVAHKARHYKISGGLDRDLWFDGDTLLRMKLIGRDHSVVQSDLS
jgi:hypothetical protein